MAKIASGLAKPDGITVISPDEQHAVLDELPVRKLWGIGPVAEEKLKRLGIETIGGFARTPESEVASILGTTIGPGLHRLAQGIDNRPVAERAESKQVSAETTFATDIVTMAELRGAVESSAASAFVRLQKDGRAARHGGAEAEEVGHEHRDAFGHAALRDTRPSDSGRGRAASGDRPDRTRAGASGRGGVRRTVDGAPGLAVPRTGPGRAGYQESKITEAAGDDGLSEPVPAPARAIDTRWHPGLDVAHPDFGHGWVQGAGHGVVTVRFETRTTGPGKARTFKEDDGQLEPADVEGSLA